MNQRNLTLLLFFLFFSFFSFSQQKFTLSGTTSEAASNETLIGVTIAIPELKTGVVTNEYGFYSLMLPEGDYRIQISYLGFEDVVQSITLDKSQKLNIQMIEAAEQLEEVIVTEDIERLDISNHK